MLGKPFGLFIVFIWGPDTVEVFDQNIGVEICSFKIKREHHEKTVSSMFSKVKLLFKFAAIFLNLCMKTEHFLYRWSSHCLLKE